jgi:hypothetical protein
MPDVLDQVAPLAHWLEASLDAPFSDKYDGQCFMHWPMIGFFFCLRSAICRVQSQW